MSAGSMISTKRIVVGQDDEGAEIAFVVRGLSLADIAAVMRDDGGVPNQWEDLIDISIGHSLDLIDTIVSLTFTSDRVVKKALEVVRRYAKGAWPHPMTGAGNV